MFECFGHSAPKEFLTSKKGCGGNRSPTFKLKLDLFPLPLGVSEHKIQNTRTNELTVLERESLGSMNEYCERETLGAEVLHRKGKAGRRSGLTVFSALYMIRRKKLANNCSTFDTY